MMIRAPFPYFALGTIVRGFGRGSKELGCPTGTDNQASPFLDGTYLVEERSRLF